MRYDAAIIGASANGLAAAAHLARAGRSVVVIDRAAEAGGRLRTREFRPGHFASAFVDSVPEIPPQILDTLDIALRPVQPVSETVRQALDTARMAAFADAGSRRRAWLPAWRAEANEVAGPDAAAMPTVEPLCGGLGTLAGAFEAAARTAGVELRLGVPVIDVLVGESIFRRPRTQGVLLADGTRIEARAVISTLDLQQSLFFWRRMPAALIAEARTFRFAGRTGRLLLALDRPVGESALELAGGGDAVAAWRDGRLPAQPPLVFDPVSARDPSLAPGGAATATVTLDLIPSRLEDGAWTHRRRVDLAAHALARLAPELPDLLGALKAVEVIVPPDIEAVLGLTEGDLDGGSPANDVVRPGPRTALGHFYLGGCSNRASLLGTGAAGLAAAIAVLAD